MGELGQVFSSLLGGNDPNKAPTPDPLAAYRPAPLGGMTEAVMGFPSVARGGGISEAGATTAGAPDPNQGPPITITGDNWKPKGDTFLGTLADAYLQANGLKPAFAQEREAQNINQAMQGFTQNPLQALRRLGMVQGHEADAYNMYNTYEDNKRADLAAQGVNDVRQEKFMTRIGGMLYNVQNAKDPATAYKNNISTIKNYAAARGVDVSDLPDTYDEGAVSNWISGSVAPEDSMRMAITSQYNDERAALAQARLEEQQRNHNLQHGDRVTNQQGVASRFQQRQSGKGGKVPDHIVSSKYGPAKIFNNGMNMSVKAGKNPDGSDRYAIFERAGKAANQWHLTGYQ